MKKTLISPLTTILAKRIRCNLWLHEFSSEFAHFWVIFRAFTQSHVTSILSSNILFKVDRRKQCSATVTVLRTQNHCIQEESTDENTLFSHFVHRELRHRQSTDVDIDDCKQRNRCGNVLRHITVYCRTTPYTTYNSSSVWSSLRFTLNLRQHNKTQQIDECSQLLVN